MKEVTLHKEVPGAVENRARNNSCLEPLSYSGEICHCFFLLFFVLRPSDEQHDERGSFVTHRDFAAPARLSQGGRSTIRSQTDSRGRVAFPSSPAAHQQTLPVQLAAWAATMAGRCQWLPQETQVPAMRARVTRCCLLPPNHQQHRSCRGTTEGLPPRALITGRLREKGGSPGCVGGMVVRGMPAVLFSRPRRRKKTIPTVASTSATARSSEPLHKLLAAKPTGLPIPARTARAKAARPLAVCTPSHFLVGLNMTH